MNTLTVIHRITRREPRKEEGCKRIGAAPEEKVLFPNATTNGPPVLPVAVFGSVVYLPRTYYADWERAFSLAHRLANS